jgi:ubiquinone/menaquinone biosynthesis C-methylase UbiE
MDFAARFTHKMTNDPYRSTAKIYDRLFDRMNRGLKLVGIRMFRPSPGMNILDVGCGTGTHLELYQRYKCHLHGLDRSPAMLEVARERLGDSAHLDLADASQMPYASQKFDLILSMLSLHEMSPHSRQSTLSEMKRVLNHTGHLLLIDFQPGPVQPIQGWVSRLIILSSEVVAGREHFRNFRHFMAQGGLTSLISPAGLMTEKQQTLAGGTFSIFLLGLVELQR